jgi:hypothetical protein
MQKFYLRRHLDITHSNDQQAVRYRVTLDYNDNFSAYEIWSKGSIHSHQGNHFYDMSVTLPKISNQDPDNFKCP